MNEEESEIERIESYLKGELKGEALSEIEYQIGNDPAFAEKVADYSLIIDEVKYKGAKEFENQVKSWENAGFKTGKNAFFHKKWYFALAAVIALLIIGGITWVLNQTDSVTQAGLFTAYFQPYDDVISERASGDEGQLLLNNAMAAYNSRDYQAAILMFQTFLQDFPNDPAASCYLAISYLANNDLEAAGQGFKSLLNSSTGLYLELSQWYLVLIYVKQNKQPLIDTHLKVITENQGHLFHQKAVELAQELY